MFMDGGVQEEVKFMGGGGQWWNPGLFSCGEKKFCMGRKIMMGSPCS